VTDATDPVPQITRDDEGAGSGDLAQGNIARLKALFPEIVTDGNVDFEVLRELLGDGVEDGEERFGLNWKGKRRARAFALTSSLGTLRPALEDSVDSEATQNIVVEGDNLESLKLLRRSYAGKIKVIYIDPPYNTGNDFVYPDNYKQSIRSYLDITGQSGEKGEALVTENDEGGRFHTNWLNMMYPRLMLARELLKDDGVIFVNIDDVEMANLKILLDEIFGQENFVADVIWQKKYGVSADAKGIPAMQDHILVYQKGFNFEPGLLPRGAKQDAAYQNRDDDPRGPWKAGDLLRMEFRPRDQYKIVSPTTGKEHRPPQGTSWRHPEQQILDMIADNRVYFGRDGMGVPSVKRFLSEVKQGVVISSWWPHADAGHTDEAKKEVSQLIGGGVFDTPKPTRLLEQVFRVANLDDGDIVMDFFAGSGTTGHAALKVSAASGKRIRYILVQIPELLFKENKDQRGAAEFCASIKKPNNLAEVMKERLRRAGDKIRREHADAKVDAGFRVYKLATSNLKPWQPDADDLEGSILDAVDNVMPGRTEEDLLVELLLKTGIDLTLPEKKRSITGRTVHALGGGTLMVCLSDVGADDAEALAQGMADWVNELDPVQTTVYFKDTGLGADGNRAATKANLAAILRQRLKVRLESHWQRALRRSSSMTEAA
jgi:adenine-specific DNA-methyltransferase